MKTRPSHVAPGLVLAALAALPVGSPAQDGAGGRAYRVETGPSTAYVVTRRSGLFGFLGHDHVLGPTEWSGRLCLTSVEPSRGRGTLTLATPSLVVDADSLRRVAGLGEGPGEEDVREIQDEMLSPEYLAAGTHPEITVEVDRLATRDAGERADPVEGPGDALLGEGRLTIRGVTREVHVPLRLDRSADGRYLVVSGRLRVSQRDFGIEPASVAGVVNVADEVELVFRLQARATGEPCR